MRKSKKYCNDIDNIILAFIKNNNQCTIIDILKYVISNYKCYDWSNKVIYNSILRLRSNRKITLEQRKQLINFTRNNKNCVINTNKIFITFVSEKVYENDSILNGFDIYDNS